MVLQCRQKPGTYRAQVPRGLQLIQAQYGYGPGRNYGFRQGEIMGESIEKAVWVSDHLVTPCVAECGAVAAVLHCQRWNGCPK